MYGVGRFDRREEREDREGEEEGKEEVDDSYEECTEGAGAGRRTNSRSRFADFSLSSCCKESADIRCWRSTSADRLWIV